MDAPLLHELSPPPDAKEQGGTEVLRTFVVDGALSIAIQRAFDDPGTWGRALADIARYVAGLYGREGGMDETEAFDAIVQALQAELAQSGPAGGADPRH